MSDLDLTTPDSYPYWSKEIIRFADIDRYGHLNNVQFATFSESGRVDFFEALQPGCTDGGGIGWVIAKLTVNFIASAYYPNDVRIGTVVRKIGNTSAILQQGLFVDDKCFGTCENVVVWADTKAEKSLPIPQDIKDRLESYLK